MDAEKRRETIVKQLKKSEKAISASTLAEKLKVSRQIIVGDIALLRARGESIESTPRGYVLNQVGDDTSAYKQQVAVSHDAEKTREELYAIVDQGCTVLDVIVEHPIYGQLTGKLSLRSRYDVDTFLKKSEENQAQPLSALTEGIHLHTITAPEEECITRAVEELKKMGVLLS